MSVCPGGGWSTGLSHSAGTGSNRLLMVAVGGESTSQGANAFSAVSYGGQALSLAGVQETTSAGFSYVNSVWYLDEAGIAAAGSSTIAVTQSGSFPEFNVAAVTYCGVDQSNPIAGTNTGQSSGGVRINPFSLMQTVEADNGVMAAIGCGNANTFVWVDDLPEATDQINGSSTLSTADLAPVTSTATLTATADFQAIMNRNAMVLVEIGAAVDSPVAAFTGSPLSGTVPLNVSFTDQTTNAVTAWSWDFGDGGTSTLQDPTHTYVTSGMYSVSLTAAGPGGSDTETKVAYVSVSVSDPAPVAGFSGAPLAGASPLLVTFTDQTVNPVTAWSWTFGDGGSSSLESPTHTYAAAGTYTVALTATGPGGADTETKGGYVVVAEPAPVAEFTGSPLAGTSPLLVTFTDQTVNPVTAWSWTFGDGGSSSLESPTHTYAAAGTYTVALTATGPGGADTETKGGYVVVAEPAPVAEFTGSPLAGTSPLLVTFTDQTVNPVTAWSWTFGDGGTSSLQDPTHTYAAAGTYTVALTATGPGGTDTETKGGYVVVAEPAPVAEFTGSPLAGTSPLLVTFTDQTVNPVTAWSWTFGDGGTSSLQDPTHTYAAAGTYTVALTATGPGGTDTETKGGYVVVGSAAPVADYVGTPTSGAAPLSVAFTDLSSGPVTSWNWVFGDGGSSSLQNPTYTYTTPGTYTVVLLTVGPGGSDGELKTDYITVEAVEPPAADFDATPRRGRFPLTVAFQDLSTGVANSWSWDFGDGASSTLQHPTHTYTSGGTHSVTLALAGPGGVDSATKVGFIVVVEPQGGEPDPTSTVLPPEESDFFGNPREGVAPLTVQFTALARGDWNRTIWDFGDGTDSEIVHPEKTYSVPGTYTVSLLVRREFGAVTTTETKVDYIVVTAPGLLLEGGGFEDEDIFEPSTSGWSSSGDAVVTVLEGGGEEGLPAEGQRWALVEAAPGSGRPETLGSLVGERARPARGRLSQSFDFAPRAPHLSFGAAFVLAGGPDSPRKGERMSVTVSDGVETHVLFEADADSEMTGLSGLFELPRTSLHNVVTDLSVLFSGAHADTRLTVEVMVESQLPGGVSSKGLLDSFRLLPRSSAVVRAGRGVNLDCYRASRPVPGRAWRADIDPLAYPRATHAVVVGSGRAVWGSVLLELGELLVDPGAPVFALGGALEGVATSLESVFPADPTLAGRLLFTQAFLVGPDGGLACNAVDLVVGY